jgi:hypothetical protein
MMAAPTRVITAGIPNSTNPGPVNNAGGMTSRGLERHGVVATATRIAPVAAAASAALQLDEAGQGAERALHALAETELVVVRRLHADHRPGDERHAQAQRDQEEQRNSTS